MESQAGMQLTVLTADGRCGQVRADEALPPF
jgi:hypothetical protein